MLTDASPCIPAYNTVSVKEALSLRHHPAFLLTVAILVAMAIIVGIPAVQHMVADRLFAKTPIDYATCDGCSCWDTIAIGPRETPDTKAYHHVYWNTNRYTLLLMINTVLYSILVYKSVEWLLGSIATGMRLPFLALVLNNVYPNYYSWWTYLMYLNELRPMRKLAKHHLYFYVTEIIVTALTLNMTRKSAKVTPIKIACVFVLTVSHLLSGFIDQYLLDTKRPSPAKTIPFVFYHWRNVSLILPDLLHVCVCSWQCRVRQWRPTRQETVRVLAATAACTAFSQCL